MATIPSTPRTNLITLATESAGPFLVGFRLLDADGLTVYVNGSIVFDWTPAATFVNGYDDSATITFLTPLPAGTKIQIDGTNPAERSDDYVNGDPNLTSKMNIELARVWATVAEIGQAVKRAVRGLSEIDPLPDAVASDLSDLGGAVAAAEAAAAAAAVSAAEALAKQNSMLRWRGNWVTATNYSLSDIVYQGGSAYICIIAHTSGTFGTDLGALRWTLFAQQGAAGPGTGDMLKSENLSGLTNVPTARSNLGLGAMAVKANVAFSDMDAAAVITATETLASNKVDNALATAKSVTDYVDPQVRRLLADKTVSVAQATLDFTEFNNALYSRYVFVLEQFRPVVDVVALGVRLSSDGGASYDSGASDYVYSCFGYASPGIATSAAVGNTGRIVRAGIGNSAAEFGVTGELTLYFAGDGTKKTRATGFFSYEQDTGNTETGHCSMVRTLAQDTDALRFLFSSGNIAAGSRVRMYGLA